MFEWLSKAVKVLLSKRSAEGKLGKSWWRSKTLWVNVLALVSLVLSDKVGVTLTGEETTAVLAVINMILRFITTEPVGFIDDGGS